MAVHRGRHPIVTSSTMSAPRNKRSLAEADRKSCRKPKKTKTETSWTEAPEAELTELLKFVPSRDLAAPLAQLLSQLSAVPESLDRVLARTDRPAVAHRQAVMGWLRLVPETVLAGAVPKKTLETLTTVAHCEPEGDAPKTLSLWKIFKLSYPLYADYLFEALRRAKMRWEAVHRSLVVWQSLPIGHLFCLLIVRVPRSSKILVYPSRAKAATRESCVLQLSSATLVVDPVTRHETVDLEFVVLSRASLMLTSAGRKNKDKAPDDCAASPHFAHFVNGARQNVMHLSVHTVFQSDHHGDRQWRSTDRGWVAGHLHSNTFVQPKVASKDIRGPCKGEWYMALDPTFGTSFGAEAKKQLRKLQRKLAPCVADIVDLANVISDYLDEDDLGRSMSMPEMALRRSLDLDAERNPPGTVGQHALGLAELQLDAKSPAEPTWTNKLYSAFGEPDRQHGQYGSMDDMHVWYSQRTNDIAPE